MRRFKEFIEEAGEYGTPHKRIKDDNDFINPYKCLGIEIKMR